LGYRTFRLLRKVEQPVVVIERNPQSRFLDELRREGSPVLIGDARDDALLEEAGVRKARSIILATDDDLGNLEIALDARRVKPDIRVVVRMFDQNMADKVRDAFNIQIAMSQASISAPAFAMSALDANIVNSFVVGDQLVVMVKWLVKPRGPLDGVAVGRIMEDLRCGVAELRRDSEPPVLFPPPETVLRAGDRVMVQGPFDALEKLKASIA
jgi:Trk K+ transport system NAD-binding subunit